MITLDKLKEANKNAKFCVSCGKATKQLVMPMSIIQYCPTCEAELLNCRCDTEEIPPLSKLPVVKQEENESEQITWNWFDDTFNWN